jgi:biofilm PGA synthesis N-glycosyltransferase PgaC
MESDSTVVVLVEAVAVFCFGYPFVMAWYWMIGGVLFWLLLERSYPPVDRPPKLSTYPPISVIVPCHNESATAEETFGVLAQVEYPDFEIIAVNDGSRDNTGEILEGLAARIAHMRVVHLAQNQGKAMALNVGALLARSEIVVIIDGDALMDPHALAWIGWYFQRLPYLGGLTGSPRIRNRTSLLGRMQVGEFSSIVGLIKRAQATYARLFTVSGVICAFRKRALSEGGWWSARSLTDDVDVTWRIQIAGWRITYMPNAVVWILMPETLRGLWRQRLRWAEGSGQMLIDNFRAMARGATPSLLPVYVNAVAAIAWSYCMIALMLLGLLHGLDLPVLSEVPTFSLIPDWYGLTLCFTYLLQATLSLALEHRFESRLVRGLFWIIWYPLAFWALSAVTAVVALPRAALRKRQGRWVSPDRGLR